MILRMEYIQFITARIEHLKKELSKLPQGNLFCTKEKNHYRWCNYVDGKKITIPKSNSKLARSLAKRKYYSLLIEDLERELSAAKKKYRPFKSASYLNSSPEVQRLLFKEVIDWANDSYKLNPEYPENLVYDCLDGGKVRSKAEASIRDALFNCGLFYRYECGIEICGITYYPDFIIWDPFRNRLIIWEHLGMMDDENYRRKSLKKLQNYERSGYHMGINLIITTETLDRHMTYEKAMLTVKDYFPHIK